MRVSELIEYLNTCDPTDLVVLSRDEEGNGYLPLSEADNNTAFYDGEIGMRSLSDEDTKQGYTDADLAGPKHVPCVTFWP